jgi:serine/threonine protein kinase
LFVHPEERSFDDHRQSQHSVRDNADANKRSTDPVYSWEYSQLREIRLIGEGSYCRVHLFQDNMGKQLVVKSPKLKIPRLMEALDTEAEILSRLYPHPCVPEALGFIMNAGLKDGLVMEYVPNGTLEYALNKPTVGFDGLAKAKCVYGIAAAMAYVHRKEILHRDLKPSNVLLNDKWEPVIADYGASRIAKGGITQTKYMGSVKFMAPEMMDNSPNRPYSRKIDVFSYAVLLREMFASNNDKYDSVSKLSPTEVCGAVRKGERLTRTKEIPKFYWDLIEKCWDQEPSNRPEFFEIVDHLIAHRSEYAYWDGIDLEALKQYEDGLYDFIRGSRYEEMQELFRQSCPH